MWFYAKSTCFARIAMGLLAGAVLAFSNPASAQSVSADGKSVQADPLKCWWKTDKTTIHVGEQFKLALTCAVVETSVLTVVPDPNQIEPGTIQLSPFEVITGVKHEDIKSGIWRYFQYEYTLRLIADGFFGQEVAIPSLNVVYNVQMASGADAQKGKDKTYILPALPMRIVSLVPSITTDIRDASRETFAQMEARVFRAKILQIAALFSFAFAGLFLVLGMVHAFGKLRGRKRSEVRGIPSWAIVRGLLQTMSRLAEEAAHDGWTSDRIGQALAALRLAGSYALGQPIEQSWAAKATPAREGQVAIKSGWFSSKKALVSGAATAQSLAAYQEKASASGALENCLLELRDSLRVFTAARYAKEAAINDAAFAQALKNTSSALRRLWIQRFWPPFRFAAMKDGARTLGGVVWSR